MWRGWNTGCGFEIAGFMQLNQQLAIRRKAERYSKLPLQAPTFAAKAAKDCHEAHPYRLS
jgi:hypothetical protein